MNRHIEDSPGRLVAGHRKGVFLWEDERIERYRLDHRVRYATDVIENSPQSGEFYEVLPVAMELARGPFMLLSVEVRSDRDFYTIGRYGVKEYVFKFLQPDGQVYATMIPDQYWRNFGRSLSKHEMSLKIAEIVETDVMRGLQQQRRERGLRDDSRG